MAESSRVLLRGRQETHEGPLGNTVNEAIEMAEDLLQNLIQETIRRSAPLPRASKPRRRRNSHPQLISLGALDSAKAQLYAAFLESGITKAEFARRVRIAKANVDQPEIVQLDLQKHVIELWTEAAVFTPHAR